MNFLQMLKQATELQGKMQAVQAELETLEFQGEAGGGLVKVRLNGKGDLRGLTIDASLMKPGEAEILEDLVTTAFRDARGKANQTAQEKMQALTAGLPIPPGLKLF